MGSVVKNINQPIELCEEIYNVVKNTYNILYLFFNSYIYPFM